MPTARPVGVCSSTECDENRWGFPNYCLLNGAGNQVCFPGCSTESDCHVYTGGLHCLSATTVDGKTVTLCVSQ